MSSRKEQEKKLIQEKCQTCLSQMLRDEDNKYCVDCDAKGPRWASWNLGVFLCIRCAGIHRNLGVHISRVKSVNLDSWTPEQVVSLQQMGNSRARAVFEAQLPDGFRRPQTDTSLESFIRAKYEHKKYLAREWVPPPPPKVDWTKEIDEEIEKQKRKKKTNIVNNSIGISGLHNNSATEKKMWAGSSIANIKSSPLPAPLPKPKSMNSPKMSRNIVNHTTSSDLLGLSSPTETSATEEKKDFGSGDNFSGFLSGPTANQTNSSTTEQNSEDNENSLAKEEEDFFNQTTLNAGDRDKTGKLSKDSILALYSAPSQGAANNVVGQFSNNSLGGFNNTFNQQQNFLTGMQQQTFSNVAVTGMQQGIMGPHAPLQASHHLMTPSSMYNAPVMTAPGAFSTSNPQLHQQMTMSQQGFAQFPPQIYASGMQQPPGFGNLLGSNNTTRQPANAISTNLNQQFGNLNLGNVWQ